MRNRFLIKIYAHGRFALLAPRTLFENFFFSEIDLPRFVARQAPLIENHANARIWEPYLLREP